MEDNECRDHGKRTGVSTWPGLWSAGDKPALSISCKGMHDASRRCLRKFFIVLTLRACKDYCGKFIALFFYHRKDDRIKESLLGSQALVTVFIYPNF